MTFKVAFFTHCTCYAQLPLQIIIIIIINCFGNYYLNANKQNSTCTIPISQKWLHPTTYTDAAICSVGTLSTGNNDKLFVIITSVSEHQSVHISSMYRQ
jgi:hypothetical protein